MSKKVVCLGDYLHIAFEYDQRLVQLVRGLPERHWDPAQRCWKVPKDHVVAVVELLQEEGFEFDQTTQALYAERRNSAPEDLTVSQLNTIVRKALVSTFPLPIWVVGEILGYDKSAHKDRVDFHLVERREGKIIAEVQAFLFPDERALIEEKLARAGYPFQIQDELIVRMLGKVDLWVQEGVYRLVIQDLDVNYTLGEAARRREEILRKLAKEDLLDRNKCLPFPLVPLRVGLITSFGSDAENDVLKTLQESGYAFQVTVHGARVQGHFTEPSVLNALDWFREHADQFDVILICRGGGSRADLAWFDSEALARAVATFPLPVVVGIGHEEDRCVLDEIGWRPKPATPSGAAKLLVQTVQKTLDQVEQGFEGILARAQAILEEANRDLSEGEARLVRASRGRLEWDRRELGHWEGRLVQGTWSCLRRAREHLARLSQALPRVVGAVLGGRRAYLQEAERRLLRASARELVGAKEEMQAKTARLRTLAHQHLAREAERLNAREQRLKAFDPKRVVERGFAILRLPSGQVVTNPVQAPVGTPVRAELRAGVLRLLSQGGEDGAGKD